MARVGADSKYLFDEAYFGALREGLGERLLLAAVSERGRFVSAGIYTVSRSIVQAHLAATDSRFGAATAPATKLLDWSMVLWSKTAGRAWFSVGGGRGGLQIRSFSTRRARPSASPSIRFGSFWTGSLRQLVVARGLRGDPGAMTGFFPSIEPTAGGRDVRRVGDRWEAARDARRQPPAATAARTLARCEQLRERPRRAHLAARGMARHP